MKRTGRSSSRSAALQAVMLQVFQLPWSRCFGLGARLSSVHTQNQKFGIENLDFWRPKLSSGDRKS
eukprot:910181-Karenia_brevis.AAC.1